MECYAALVTSATGLIAIEMVVSLKGRTQTDNCLCAFNRRKPLLTSIMPAATHHKAIPASRQRLTLRVTRRMVPIMFSAMLVQASDRRSSFGSFNRTTVRISSRPSRMLAATPGHCASSRRARLRINFQPCRHHRAPGLAQSTRRVAA